MTEFLRPYADPRQDIRPLALQLAFMTYEIAPVEDASPAWAAKTIREIADGYAAWLSTETTP